MIYLQPLFAADVPSSAHLHGDPTASRPLSDDLPSAPHLLFAVEVPSSAHLHGDPTASRPLFDDLPAAPQPLFAVDVPSYAHLHGDPTASRSLSEDSAGLQPLCNDVAALRRCRCCHIIESQEDMVTCGDSTMGCG
jgi:hypothetical protein